MAEETVINTSGKEEEENIWHGERLKEIPEHVKEYIQTRIELAKLNAVEKASSTAGGVALGALLGFFGLFALVMLSVSLGLALGKLFDSNALGFLAVGGLYLLLAGLAIAFKKPLIINPIVNGIIKAVLGNDDKGAKN